jgi:hypothetical protein
MQESDVLFPGEMEMDWGVDLLLGRLVQPTWLSLIFFLIKFTDVLDEM